MKNKTRDKFNSTVSTVCTSCHITTLSQFKTTALLCLGRDYQSRGWNQVCTSRRAKKNPAFRMNVERRWMERKKGRDGCPHDRIVFLFWSRRYARLTFSTCLLLLVHFFPSIRFTTTYPELSPVRYSAIQEAVVSWMQKDSFVGVGGLE